MTGPALIRGGTQPHHSSRMAGVAMGGLSPTSSTTSGTISAPSSSTSSPCRLVGEGGQGGRKHKLPDHGVAHERSCPGIRRISSVAVPISKARDLLVEAVRALPVTAGGRATGGDDDGILGGRQASYARLEVEVTDVESEEDALVWLRGQAQISPKIYFRVPDRSLVVAGAGASHIVSGPGDMSEARYKDVLSAASPGLVYYGGGRFDPGFGKPAAEWDGFGGCYFMLPAVELVRRRQGDDDGDGQKSPFVLACNLRTLDDDARDVVVSTLRSLALEEDEGVDAPLPAPVSCEEPAHFEAWTDSITRALDAMKAGDYRKVVLARAALFTFPCRPRALDIVLRLRDHYGYLFCIQLDEDRAFLGCTPEQLFKVEGDRVVTEALAGTRPRGSSPEEDAALADELMASSKDRFENLVTAEFIEEQLGRVASRVERSEACVLKLRHVQHIRHKISAYMCGDDPAVEVEEEEEDHQNDDEGRPPGTLTTTRAFKLLGALHPTPAVCGQPRHVTIRAIQALESFDRGFYAGPVGYMSSNTCEFAVALRSVLVVRERARVFAGAGIVPGSTAEGEWVEVAAKMQNFVRMFPSPPAPLRNLPNLATLWATLTIEELVRNGVTHFCVAPGSRSTPLVVAAARHARAEVVVHHDERGAGFYAVGYARAKGGGPPAAVIVTSGTAVANLLPAVVEASTDGVPMLLLTADRPPEARDCGANQTVTQPGIFGAYARWSRDMPCPTPDILVTSLLSDIDYAISRARGGEPGPVHLNFMFRENLAPDPGPVRDSAVPDASSEWSDACLRDRRLATWERSLRPYTTFPCLQPSCLIPSSLLATLRASRRGLIVLGRLPTRQDRTYARWLAQSLRWPVLADVASGLRRDPALVRSSLLVPLYDTILADPAMAAALDPDMIIQLGSPLVSKRLPKWAASACSTTACLVMVTPGPARRDPELAVTYHMCSTLPNFVRALDSSLDLGSLLPSGLLPLLTRLGAHLEKTVVSEQLSVRASSGSTGNSSNKDSGSSGSGSSLGVLTEPMVADLVARHLCPGAGLFLSNSMPVRDMDAYAGSVLPGPSPPLSLVAVNRGASGIDGVLSTAIGYASGLSRPVTLLIGDMALLHDLNSLYALRPGAHMSGAGGRKGSDRANKPPPPICVVLVNNGGGGIFSFLPIAAHTDVFESLFAASHDLGFADACKAFGLRHRLCLTQHDFLSAYQDVQQEAAAAATTSSSAGSSNRPVTILEVVTDRGENVCVHRDLTSRSRASQHAMLLRLLRLEWVSSTTTSSSKKKPTLLLLHGFLGCKEDWAGLLPLLSRDFNCLSVDLPGHGLTALTDPEVAGTSSALYSMPVVALALIRLLDQHGVSRCAVMGYSMGGRLAAFLAKEFPDRVTALVLLSAHLGLRSEGERVDRWQDDCRLSERLEKDCGDAAKWDAWLRWWYSKPLWGRLAERSQAYQRMMTRRRASFESSADVGGMARAVLGMSLARQPSLWDWLKGAAGPPVLYVYGAADSKYAALAEEVRALADGASRAIEVRSIEDAGHAVMAEKEQEVGQEALAFLRRHLSSEDSTASTTTSSSSSSSSSSSASCLPGGRSSPGQAEATRVAAMKWKRVSLRLHKPLALSTGPLTTRQSIILTITSETGCMGVGEVSPLPGFSIESLEEAEAQLHQVAGFFHTPSPLPSPSALPAWLASTMMPPVKGASPSLLLHPSVRCGIEMAMIHLLAQEHRTTLGSIILAAFRPPGAVGGGGGAGGPMVQASHIRINALIGRGVGQAANTGGSRELIKIKVGGGSVEEDAQRANQLLRDPGARLRIDANQAWSLKEALSFVRLLERPEAIEYMEEPLQDPMQLPELYRQGGRAVRFALDESLAMVGTVKGSRTVEQLLALEGLTAVVLKPTILGGMSRCLEISLLARARGLSTVITSSFESSVGLCHLAALASVTGRFGNPSIVAHGLGTYAAMATEDEDSDQDEENQQEGSTDKVGRRQQQQQQQQRGQGFETSIVKEATSLVCDVGAAQRVLDACVRTSLPAAAGSSNSNTSSSVGGRRKSGSSSSSHSSPGAKEEGEEEEVPLVVGDDGRASRA